MILDYDESIKNLSGDSLAIAVRHKSQLEVELWFWTQ